jgi:ABC-type antimicrobial peptide transport system permease subunit
MARTEVVPQAVIEDMRSVVRRLDPSVPVLQAKTMRRQLEDSLEGTLAGTAAIGVVGTLALGLASIGLYAVVAFAVSRRSLEIGIRIALGSGRWRVLWLTMREAMAVVGIGLLLGLGLSVVLSQTLSGLLYGVAPVDPIALGLALTVLGLVTLVAAWLPARRATARHPLERLRHD